MNQGNFLALYMMFIFAVVQVICIITPNLTRKDIVFGIRIPQDKVNIDEIKNIKKIYTRNSLLVGIPAMLVISWIIYKFPDQIVIFTGVLGFLFLDFLIYLFSNKETKRLKKSEKWFDKSKNIVVIDTKYSKLKNTSSASMWIFVIPLCIILLNVVIGYKVYDLLPNMVPVHWDFSGNITGYKSKSMSLIWMIPITQIIVTVVFFIVYKSIGWSKQEISAQNPVESVEKNKVFRKVWSYYMVIYCVFINVFFTMENMQILRVFNIDYRISMFMDILFIVITFLSVIIISLKVGQGGSKLKIKEQKKMRKLIDTEKMMMIFGNLEI